MQKFKILTLSLLIGATLQAWDGPIDYLSNFIMGDGISPLPSQTEAARRNYKTPAQRADARTAEIIKSANGDLERSRKAHEDRVNEGKVERSARDEKAEVLSLVEDDSLTPAQLKFLAKQKKIQNTQAPEWFNNIPVTDGKIIGYGMSENFTEASDLAVASIARQLSAQITTEDVSKKSEVDGQYNNSFTSEVKIKTEKMDIVNFKLLKTARANGIYFYAKVYDSRELTEKIVSLGEKLVHETNPSYLNYSKIGLKLNKILGFDPVLELQSNVSFVKLLVGGEIFNLDSSDVEKFFSNTSDGILISSLSSDIYNSSEIVNFNITSKYHGYISSIWVDNEGFTGINFENVEIYNSINAEKIRNPHLVEMRESKELIVTIFSEEPIDISDFQFKRTGQFTTMVELDNQHKIGQLMKLMKKYHYCTSVVTVRSALDDTGKFIRFEPGRGAIYAD